MASSTNASSLVYEASRSSPEAIRRLLETRGFLTTLLQPSPDDLEAYVSMSDANLAQVLSALAEKCRRTERGDKLRALPGCVLPALRFLERVIRGRLNDSGCSAVPKEELMRRKRRRVESDCGGGWTTCLAFMIAYDTLVDLGALDSSAREGGKGCEAENARCCENDEVIRKALIVIELLRTPIMFGRDKESRDSPVWQSSVEKCFGLELQNIDALVASRKRAQEANGDINSFRREDNESIWIGIDLDGDDDDESSENPAASAMDKTTKRDKSSAIPKAGKDFKVQMPVARQREATDDEPVGTNEDVTNGLEASVSPLYQAAIDLRTTLLNSVPGATQAEIDSMAERIVHLIQKGGTECGVEGVAKIGNILTSDIDENSSTRASSTAHTQDDNAAVVLTDELIASVSKKYIDRGTSAMRVSAYLQSLVLPLISNLNQSKSASRTLVSLLSWLVRERPSETFTFLLVPALCSTVDKGENKAGEGCNDKVGPSKSMCDLAGRVVKSAKEKEPIAELLTCLILGTQQVRRNIPDGSASKEGMMWTEESIPIMTACVNKRAPLSDETVTEISKQIQHAATDMSKSMKFSTLFHAFVTKYGNQLRKLSLVEELSQSAEKLMTFMGKTIKSVLKKM